MKRYLYKPRFAGKSDRFDKPDFEAANRRMQQKHGIDTLTTKGCGVWACWSFKKFKGTLIELDWKKENPDSTDSSPAKEKTS
jgi:hypothetical protein